MRRWVVFTLAAVTLVLAGLVVVGLDSAGVQRPATSGILHVVALGDSVPSGAACHCDAYVQGVADALGSRAGRPAVADNFAEAGDTTSDVIDALDTDAVRAGLRHSDVVLVQIGANDVDTGSLDDGTCLTPGIDCWADDAAGVAKRLRQILATVRADVPDPQTPVAVLGYWNVVEAGDVGRARGPTFVANAARATREVNDAIKAETLRAHDVYVDAAAAFAEDRHSETDLLADDGDHPNVEGHEVLARAVLAALPPVR